MPDAVGSAREVPGPEAPAADAAVGGAAVGGAAVGRAGRPDPVLRTERLVLHPATADLARALLDGPPPPGLAAADGFPRADDVSVLQGVLGSGPDARGVWLIAQGGVVVGTVGVAGPVSPQGDQEIGYGLVRSARGAGVATEAVGAVCAVLERRRGVRRLTGEVTPGNEASVRLLARLGFARVGRGSGPHLLWARAAPGQPEVRSRISGRHVC